MQYQSPNYDDRTSNDAIIDMIVIHYTGMQSGDEALAHMCNPAAKVSAHYMIDLGGEIIALVPEEKRAWHAGISYWRGRDGLNDCSIGIEIVNKGHEWGYNDFPDEQIDAVLTLSKDITERYNIKPYNIVAHSDIAPDRKQDPGELFPWHELYQNNIGIYYNPDYDQQIYPALTTASQHNYIGLLGRLGYDVSSKKMLSHSIIAFKRHFCPDELSSDNSWNENCAKILANLLLQCQPQN